MAELPEEERPEPHKLYRVVAGFHRFDAWIEAHTHRGRGEPDFRSLVCTVHVGATADQLFYLHLRENVRRSDLTPQQRMEWAHRLGKMSLFEGNREVYRMIVGKEQDKKNQTGEGLSTARTKPDAEDRTDETSKSVGGRPSSWFGDWIAASGLPRQTAVDQWSAFAKAQGLKLTPAKATEEQRAAFFAWGLTRPQEGEAEAARHAEEAAAKKRAEAYDRETARIEAVIVSRYFELIGLVGVARGRAFLEKLEGGILKLNR